MRNKIKAELQKIDPVVDYGIGRFKNRETWDCLVYRKSSQKSTKNQYTDKYVIGIIREDFIPDGMIEKVQTAMISIGLKPTEEEIEYIYLMKDSDIVVESCFIEFFKSRKGCN